MSLVRAFTTRRNKSEALNNVHVGRAASQRQGRPVLRAQISSPVALLSSTNALSYDAPDITGTAPVDGAHDFSSSSSRTSHEDSDASTFDIQSNTDASSIEDSPISPEPEPNHLSCYFKKQDTSPRTSAQTTFDAPTIPQRVPSHSKKAHERVHRKRSVQRLMSPPTSIVRNSTEMFKPVEALQENPFGNELAQLDEVAEEFNNTVRDAEFEADAAIIKSRGLAQYSAESYLEEIHSLIYEAFQAEEQTWF